MPSIPGDLRYTLRILAKSPGFAVIAIATLALGIGANTAVFTVANALLLRPLPYSEPERLVLLTGAAFTEDDDFGRLSYPFFTAVSERSHTLSGVAACIFETFNLTGNGDPEQLSSARVSWNFFDVLGVRPVAGRTFLKEEDRPGGAPVVLLSYEIATRLFSQAETAVGRTITLDSTSYTVVGVLPKDFVCSLFGPRREIWAPRVFDMSFVSPARVARGGTYFNLIGRLRNGVSRGQSQTEVAALYRQYCQDHPGNFDATLNLNMRVENLQDELVSGIRPTVLILWAAVSVVLLIACANVASLLLSRALRRRKEFAVRAALGATRRAVIRQLLVESVLIALAGGLGGIALARAGTRVLVALNQDNLQAANLSMNPQVLAFTLLLSIGSGVLFGLAPSFQLFRTDLNADLRDEGRGSSGSRRGSRSRTVLVVAQVALSMVLLVSSGLLLRSFLQISKASPGFDPGSTLTMQITLPHARYAQPDETVAFYRGVLQRVQNLPGVLAAAFSTALPVVPTHLTPVLFQGQPPVALGKRPIVNLLQVSPEYLEVTRVPLVSGRMFTERDDARSTPVALVNQLTVRRYWRGENPIGKQIWIGSLPRPWEVVGVLGDTRNNGLTAATIPEVLLPFPQMTVPYLSLSLRTATDPYSVMPAVRKQIAAVDRDQPVTEVKTMTELVESLSAGRRFTMFLIGVLSGAAFFLALVGIYGVIAYGVAQQTPELGIRMALGATRGDILRMVIGNGMAVAGTGVLIGVVVSLALTRVMSSLLYQTRAYDPLVLTASAVLFIAAALLAAYVPARRVTRIDPAGVLRAE